MLGAEDSSNRTCNQHGRPCAADSAHAAGCAQRRPRRLARGRAIKAPLAVPFLRHVLLKFLALSLKGRLSSSLGLVLALSIMPRHTRRKLAEYSVVRAAEVDASDDEAAAINAPDGGMIPRGAPIFVGTGWSPSDLVFRPEFHLSQWPRAGLADGKPFRTFWSLAEVQNAFKAIRADEEAMEIWWCGVLLPMCMYLPRLLVPISCLDGEFCSQGCTAICGIWGSECYFSTIRGTGLSPRTSMLAQDEDFARLYVNARGDAVCRSWRDFVHRKGSYDDFLRRLAPPVHFVLPEEEAPRVRVRRWMLLIDSWKRHCAKLTRKHFGRDREERRRNRRGSVDRETQGETFSRQEGPSLDLGQGSDVGAHQRHSDADQRAASFVHVDPTRHSFGGASSSRPFVSPPGYYFGESGPQPWGADSWAYYAEMERMRQAQMFAPYLFMAMPPPYQYPSPQQGVHPSPGTLRISQQDPSTHGTELDRDLECLRRRNRDKEPVVDVTADDDSDRPCMVASSSLPGLILYRLDCICMDLYGLKLEFVWLYGFEFELVWKFFEVLAF
ncbi:hypothetical protein SOVF_074380, partial [Spinacia oleracea]